MKKRQHRATSKAAHESIKEHKREMYGKIEEGLRKLRVGGTFHEIAEAAGIKPEQCWKRLPEMIEMGLVFNVGTTRTTPSGRQAMVRQLVEIKIQEQQQKPKEEQKTFTPQKPLTQANLF